MSAKQAAQDGVDISKAAPQQLQDLGKAIEQELQTLTASYNQLLMGAKKFQESQEVLNYMKNYGKNKEVMVPLTSSLYVPGVLEDPENVLVEVGASYFIEQKNDKAVDYCKRKNDLLSGNAKKVQEIIQVKKVQMQKVQNMLQKRMTEYQAAMAQQ